MKKTIMALFALFCLTTTVLPQAKKPTLMVVPSDLWCNKNGFMMEFDNQGRKVKVPDYKKALQENLELMMVISKINELMTDRGFPLKNLESSLKTLESEGAEEEMMMSRSGSEIGETPVDQLKKVAKADIWIQLTWAVNTLGPKRSITFNLQGLDAYTDKQIAGASGTGQPSFTAELPILLEESVLSYLDNFNVQLQSHFDDLFKNGREVVLRIRTWANSDIDLETEFAGRELGAIIEEWISKNTVEGRFNTSDATESMMLFEQVRIPLYDASGRATDARGWARELQKYLKTTYKVDAKLTMRGLGQAALVIGEK